MRLKLVCRERLKLNIDTKSRDVITNASDKRTYDALLYKFCFTISQSTAIHGLTQVRVKYLSQSSSSFHRRYYVVSILGTLRKFVMHIILNCSNETGQIVQARRGKDLLPEMWKLYSFRVKDNNKKQRIYAFWRQQVQPYSEINILISFQTVASQLSYMSLYV